MTSEEMKALNEQIHTIKIEIENFAQYIAEIEKLKHLIDETAKLWVFIQKFIDEQTVDQIKIIRSPNREMKDKFEAMEWFVRYVEFATPEAVTTGYRAFRDKYATSTMT